MSPRIVILLLLSVVQATSCDPASNPSAEQVAEANLRGPLLGFLSKPCESTWEQLCSAADRNPLSDTAKFVTSVERYHDSRIHRDLPNSMALVGTTPDEFVEGHMKKLEAELVALRGMTAQPRMLEILKALILQESDDQLTYSACEIACRTMPQAYRQMMRDVSRPPLSRPRLVQVMSQVETRWAERPE